MSVRARVWWGEVGGAPWDPREVHGIGFLGKGSMRDTSQGCGQALC